MTLPDDPTKNRTPLPEQKNSHVSMCLKHKNDPRAIINMVEPELARQIMNLSDKYFVMKENTFRKNLKPSRLLWALRYNFYKEYSDACFRKNLKMKTHNILSGVCFREIWHQICEDALSLAFVIRPPESTHMSSLHIVRKSFDQMEIILGMKNTTSKIEEKFDVEGRIISRTTTKCWVLHRKIWISKKY